MKDIPLVVDDDNIALTKTVVRALFDMIYQTVLYF